MKVCSISSSSWACLKGYILTFGGTIGFTNAESPEELYIVFILEGVCNLNSKGFCFYNFGVTGGMCSTD